MGGPGRGGSGESNLTRSKNAYALSVQPYNVVTFISGTLCCVRPLERSPRYVHAPHVDQKSSARVIYFVMIKNIYTAPAPSCTIINFCFNIHFFSHFPPHQIDILPRIIRVRTTPIRGINTTKRLCAAQTFLNEMRACGGGGRGGYTHENVCRLFAGQRYILISQG